ncbi:MAG TPA: YicC family protein [Chromatiales bacterium]|nr:YicC family protein [Chromatiales bacterium]HDO33838.1 YicC family protein [Chromatiales bacterium]
MTGFARHEDHGAFGLLSWELRSVNHRYLEITLRLPEDFRVLEERARAAVKRVLHRGKLDATLRFEAAPELRPELSIDRELASRLVHISREIDSLLYNPAAANSVEILRWPGVLQMTRPDLEPVQDEALRLLDEALAQLVESRLREGTRLQEVIAQRCDALETAIPPVRERLPDTLEAYRRRLQRRLAELKIAADPGRLEQELALTAQRMDVEEELDRLTMHVAELRRVLERDEPVGRRLDFLMQEFNREANTLASKSADGEVTRACVEMKVLIEQMREQVQNIE